MEDIIKQLKYAIEKNSVIDKKLLIDKINQLINSDFSKLVSILYRLDISEQKLKQSLNANKERDAGEIIADLVIERELQKIKTRQQFKPGGDISENDKW